MSASKEPSQEDNSRSDRPLNPFELSVDFRLSEQQVKQLSATALAYLGDAVYELYIRGIYLLPPKRQHSYHQEVVTQVRAETQAQHLRSLQPYLNFVEQDVVRRGRNATSRRPKRVSAAIYQQATSLEALMGYLYLIDRDRLAYLLEILYPDREIK